MGQPANIVSFHRPGSVAGKALVESLVREHGEALKRFVSLRIRSARDVEDLLQDVFVRLTRLNDLGGKVTHGRGSTRAYLYSIANNLIVDRVRQNAMRARHGLTEVADMPDPVSAETPDRIVAARQDLDRVMRLLASMNPKWRMAFELNRFQFMSHRQIAQQMGLTTKRVEKYIASALAVLRQDREQQRSRESDV